MNSRDVTGRTLRTRRLPALPAVLTVLLLCASCGQDVPVEPGPAGRPAEKAFRICRLKPNARKVKLYDLFELTFDIPGGYSNPFDPEDIAVDAVFETPSGKTHSVPGFYYREFDIRRVAGGKKWRDIKLMKVYVIEANWTTGVPITFYLDDFTIERGGKTETVFDCEKEGVFEAIDATIAVDDGKARQGRHSLKVTIVPDKSETWPGVFVHLPDVDWHDVERFAFWCFTENEKMEDSLRIEFVNGEGEKLGRSFKNEVVQGRWSKLVLDVSPFGGKQELQPVGEPCWKVRYAPVETGEHAYQIVARDATGTACAARGKFNAVPSGTRGFIRVAENRQYLEFDDGSPYFAVGENCCWPSGDGGLAETERWFKKLHAAGANYVRLWHCGFTQTAIEAYTTRKDRSGRYNLENAWLLDRTLELARRYGLHTTFCIETHGSLRRKDEFSRFPYSAQRNGPCTRPLDFFTNREAVRLFRNRLNYCAARWGWDTYVMSWELFNEVDLVDGFDARAIAKWHSQMARTLRSADPYHHIIHTSISSERGCRDIDTLPEMDIVHTHLYGAPDFASATAYLTSRMTEALKKPYWLGEIGPHTQNSDDLWGEYDPGGVFVHNGAWSSLASGGAGTAMAWYWDTYVDRYDLYGVLAPIAKFAARIPFNTQEWKGISVKEMKFAPGVEPPETGAMFQPVHGSWSPAEYNRPVRVKIGSDGSPDFPYLVAGVVHGLTHHGDLHNPVTFEVDYETDGRFGLDVSGVSGYGGATLVISLDGQKALTADFADTALLDTGTMLNYKATYSIDVPAGSHEITVENTGTDWFTVNRYRFDNLTKAKKPELNVFGQAGETTAFVWFHNKRHTWVNVHDELPQVPQPESFVRLSGLKDGRYSLTWFDTYTGESRKGGFVQVTGGAGVVTTPIIEKDVAALLTRR